MSLILRGVDFGSAAYASGLGGFLGEGYWYHPFARLLGGTLKGMTFTAKTTTLLPRQGNMPMRADRITPVERLPKSIFIAPGSGHVLNAVGLSGPGAEWLFETGRWQRRTRPFMISFMSVAKTVEERQAETEGFAELMAKYLPYFKAPVALQFNRACPNTGHLPAEFYDETNDMLTILGKLEIPIVVNYNPVVPVEVLVATANHSNCDGLCIANTIPWGDKSINWVKLFGTEQSPLAARNLPIPGGGGLSGPACLPITLNRVKEARAWGIKKPIIAGNGIRKPTDVVCLRQAGADMVSFGSIMMTHPNYMPDVIGVANAYDE